MSKQFTRIALAVFAFVFSAACSIILALAFVAALSAPLDLLAQSDEVIYEAETTDTTISASVIPTISVMTETRFLVYSPFVARVETASTPVPPVAPTPTPPANIELLANLKTCNTATPASESPCAPLWTLRDAMSATKVHTTTVKTTISSRLNGSFISVYVWIDDLNPSLTPDHECKLGYAYTPYDSPRAADPDIPANSWFSECAHVHDNRRINLIPAVERYGAQYPGNSPVQSLFHFVGLALYEDGSFAPAPMQ